MGSITSRPAPLPRMASLTGEPAAVVGSADEPERRDEWRMSAPAYDRPRAPVNRLRRLQIVIKKGEKIVRWKSFPDPRVGILPRVQ